MSVPVPALQLTCDLSRVYPTSWPNDNNRYRKWMVDGYIVWILNGQRCGCVGLNHSLEARGLNISCNHVWTFYNLLILALYFPPHSKTCMLRSLKVKLSIKLWLWMVVCDRPLTHSIKYNNNLGQKMVRPATCINLTQRFVPPPQKNSIHTKKAWVKLIQIVGRSDFWAKLACFWPSSFKMWFGYFYCTFLLLLYSLTRMGKNNPISGKKKKRGGGMTGEFIPFWAVGGL